LIHDALDHLRETGLELLPVAVHAFELRDGLVIAQQDGLVWGGGFPADLIGAFDQHHPFALQRFVKQLQVALLNELEINRAQRRHFALKILEDGTRIGHGLQRRIGFGGDSGEADGQNYRSSRREEAPL